MFSDFLKQHIKSQASYVEFGYGQVEPNHLSAQRTGQIYAQLPANKDIDVLEQGQFVKYDYATGKNGEVNFTGAGEWMLVFNEIKLYRTRKDGSKQWDCEYAMRKDDFDAKLYAPYDWENAEGYKSYPDGSPKKSRYLNGVDSDGNDSITLGDKTYKYDDVTAGPDYYEMNYNEDPFTIWNSKYEPRHMDAGTKMVPRVFKTNVGDIFTTNTINAESLSIGDILTPGANGILEVGDGDMKWQVVKVYTMPDHQKGVKIMRIA